MEEAAFPRASQMHTSRKPKAIIILLAVLLLLALLVYAGTRFLGTGTGDEEDQNVVPTAVIAPTSSPTPDDKENKDITPTPEKEESPTPTKKESSSTTLDKESIAIQVLNGSGVSGAAGDVEKVLSDAGYTDITTGNADNFDYEDISISVKSTKANFLKLLETDLSDSYTIGDTDTNLSSSDYDVVVIVGK